MKTPLILLIASLSSAALASLIPVSVRDPGRVPSITGDGASGSAEFAGGNRFVVFLSGAGNLVTNDSNGPALDLFRRDLVDGRTELLSLTSSGAPAAGRVEDFSVSADGRRVVFSWAADDSSVGDTNRLTDVYVRDLDAGTTRLVSVRGDGTGAGNGLSGSPTLSGNGRFVVFESKATDLVEGEVGTGGGDVFRRDLESGVTEWISRMPVGFPPEPTPGGSFSRSPVVSDDGSVVAFISDSVSIAPVEGIGTTVLVWNSGGVGLKRVRLPGPSSGLLAPLAVDQVDLSRDGRFLVFAVSPGPRVPEQSSGIWRLDVTSGAVSRISEDRAVSLESLATGPSLSSDGLTVAFSVEPPNGTVGAIRVLIWKEGSGLHTLEELRQTVPPVGGEPAQSSMPVLSPDGEGLVFVSDSAIPEAGVTIAGTARLYYRVLATGATRLISDDTDSVSPAFSPDGSRLATEEQIPVEVVGDDNGELDVVVTTLADGVRQVASLAQLESGVQMASGSSIGGGGISDDGRFVLYSSQAGDLVSQDFNQFTDAFHFDRLGKTNRVVSTWGEGRAAGGVIAAVLSRNGRRSAFVRGGAGLTAGDTNASPDVYVRDLDTGILVLASAQDGSDKSLAMTASEPVISADGQWVGFRAFPVGSPGRFNLYLRDLQNRRTWWLDDPTRIERGFPNGGRLQLSADGATVLFLEMGNSWYVLRRVEGTFQTIATFVATDAWLSADGRRVVIQRTISDPVRALVSRSLADGTETVLLDSSRYAVRDLQVSADSSVITYAQRSNPSGPPAGNPWQVWAMPIAGGTEELISRSPSGSPGSEDSREPQISADGRFIVFRSGAANLVPDDTNEVQDIFVRDRYTGVTTLLSGGDGGLLGNQNATRPEISGDGGFATFTTFADNLLPGDHNGLGDVVMAEIPREPAPDTDGDGLPDGWERDQFGSLAQDGAGDADGDGATNAEELAAHTAPTDSASHWRVVLSGTSALPAVQWTGHAGVEYVVERREDLGAGGVWLPMGEMLSGHEGTMEALLDSDAFYRVTAR